MRTASEGRVDGRVRGISSKTAAEVILVGIIRRWLWRVKGVADSQLVPILEVVAVVVP